MQAESAKGHKAGFVSIVGKPNAGKSTLLNALMGEKVAAVTYKAQTTRHRIFGMYNTEDEQIVFSDTPGMLEAGYGLHKRMMAYVRQSLEDADLLLLVIDAAKPLPDPTDDLWRLLNKPDAPLHLVLNKADEAEPGQLKAAQKLAEAQLPVAATHIISALNGDGVPALLETVRTAMPEHPAYFDKEQLSDRSERFFAAEILREKIFLNYREEIPYATAVVIEAFQDGEDMLRIRSEILVERPTQKGILIGQGGQALKKTATEARQEMETFFGKKVFLETYVRVKPDWRNSPFLLHQLGYTE